MTTTERERAVHALAMDIKQHARVHALKVLARETTETFTTLIVHGVPVDAVRDCFGIRLLSERTDEEQRGERFR